MPLVIPLSCVLLPPLLLLGVLSSIFLCLCTCFHTLRNCFLSPRASSVSPSPHLKRAVAAALLYTLALTLLSLPAPYGPSFSPCSAPRALSTAESFERKDADREGNEVGGGEWVRKEERRVDAGNEMLSRKELPRKWVAAPRDAKARKEGHWRDGEKTGNRWATRGRAEEGKGIEGRARDAGEEQRREERRNGTSVQVRDEAKGATAGGLPLDASDSATGTRDGKASKGAVKAVQRDSKAAEGDSKIVQGDSNVAEGDSKAVEGDSEATTQGSTAFQNTSNSPSPSTHSLSSQETTLPSPQPKASPLQSPPSPPQIRPSSTHPASSPPHPASPPLQSASPPPQSASPPPQSASPPPQSASPPPQSATPSPQPTPFLLPQPAASPSSPAVAPVAAPLGSSSAPPPARFFLYRLIGNDMPPLQCQQQLLRNTLYALQHEPAELPQGRRLWVLNNVVNGSVLRATLHALRSHGVKNEDILVRPVNLTYIATLPRHQWLDAVTAQNEARNFMLEHGRAAGAQWVLAFDGNQFVTAEAWRLIVQAADRHEQNGKEVFKVPMYRLQQAQSPAWLNASSLANQLHRFAPHMHESQVAFRGDSPLRYHEGLGYGHNNKLELMRRVCGTGNFNDKKNDRRKLQQGGDVQQQEQQQQEQQQQEKQQHEQQQQQEGQQQLQKEQQGQEQQQQQQQQEQQQQKQDKQEEQQQQGQQQQEQYQQERQQQPEQQKQEQRQQEQQQGDVAKEQEGQRQVNTTGMVVSNNGTQDAAAAAAASNNEGHSGEEAGEEGRAVVVDTGRCGCHREVGRNSDFQEGKEYVAYDCGYTLRLWYFPCVEVDVRQALTNVSYRNQLRQEGRLNLYTLIQKAMKDPSIAVPEEEWSSL